MFQAIGIGLLAIIVLIGFVYLFRKTAETSASIEPEPINPPPDSSPLSSVPDGYSDTSQEGHYEGYSDTDSPSVSKNVPVSGAGLGEEVVIGGILEDDVPYGSYLLRAGIIELDDLRRLSTLDEVDGIGRVTGLEVREALKKADEVPDDAIPPITTRD